MFALFAVSFIYLFIYLFIYVFLLQTGNKLLTVHEHTKQINDIQMYKDQTMFVTASKDHTAKVSVESMPGQSGTQFKKNRVFFFRIFSPNESFSLPTDPVEVPPRRVH